MKTMQDFPEGKQVMLADNSSSEVGYVIAHLDRYPNTLIVEWDDEVGNKLILKHDVSELKESSDSGVNVFELEKEFQAVVNSHNGTVKLLVSTAQKILNQAKDLSNQHGIPFEFEEKIYVPLLFGDKYSYIDRDKLHDITKIGHLENCNIGWNSSAWCPGGG